MNYNVGHHFSLAPPTVLDTLTTRLARIVKTIRGEARLTESNIQEALREVRVALLEADVALPVVKHFIESVRGAALGAEVVGSLTPGQALVGVVHRELAKLMGEANVALDLATQPPAIVLMAGLQGSGKTTTCGKLARLLARQEESRAGLVRRLSPGGDRAAEDRFRASRRAVHALSVARSHPTSRAARSTTRARTTWTCSSSTPRGASRSTRR